jgi:type IV pilus assembly protein PilY1
MAQPVTMDLNLNYSTDVIYIGNAYVAGGDKGKMYRISMRSSNNPAPDAAPWPYKYDISASPWLMTTLFESATPVTASPTASIDEDDNIWVYFGTGKYYNDADKLDNTQQFFYGIKDACAYGVCGTTVTLAELYDSTSIIVLTNEEVVNATATTWDAFIPEVQAKKGWYLDLAAGGERQLTRPSVLGGVVLFAPFTPDADICGYGGTGAVYALYYETGTAFPEDILGTDPYGATKQESLKKIELGKGLTSEIGLHVGQKATSTGFIQQGTGTVVQVEVDPALGIKSGIIGWKQY